MISFLRGILMQCNQENMIVEVSGIGYEVQIHSRTLSILPAVGSAVLVYTYLQVLDNDFKLYGFMNREELELFKLLLGVSGIGARGALNILSAMKPHDFYQSIASNDEKRLVTVPGIGKKTAQRLVFELRERIEKLQGMVLTPGEDSSAWEDLLEALEALGYQRSEVFPLIMDMRAHNELGEQVEENIKKVLRRKAMQMKK